MTATSTPHELAYLRDQRLGRLATVDAGGAPQNNPADFRIDGATGDVLVGGRNLAATRKFRNIQRNPRVAFVVDDIASVNPWVVRGVELRGSAQALTDVDPPRRGISRELIRLTPQWIASWGIEPGELAMKARR
ncbi:MAG: PPOX class F420-dependent oxidoreductase [Nitriliruptorales bacterium]|nr:PPOX class F420-dependent oxidoreductase [Nitriliruptorales bacterium]